MQSLAETTNKHNECYFEVTMPCLVQHDLWYPMRIDLMMILLLEYSSQSYVRNLRQFEWKVYNIRKIQLVFLFQRWLTLNSGATITTHDDNPQQLSSSDSTKSYAKFFLFLFWGLCWWGAGGDEEPNNSPKCGPTGHQFKEKSNTLDEWNWVWMCKYGHDIYILANLI
jgi:hypothetical protein